MTLQIQNGVQYQRSVYGQVTITFIVTCFAELLHQFDSIVLKKKKKGKGTAC